jgi:hypothetical protein
MPRERSTPYPEDLAASRSQGSGPSVNELGAAGAPERARLTAPFENLLQEVLRRAAAAGFSSLRFTEEALRRGLADAVPSEWVDFVSRQSGEVRADIIDRFAQEFGAWLREVDLEAVLGRVLDRYQFRATIEIKSEPRAREEGAVQPIARRR